MPTTITLYRWRVRNERGEWRVTRHHLSEVDALAIWPDAERLDWSRDVRTVPDDPLYGHTTSAWQRTAGTPVR